MAKPKQTRSGRLKNYLVIGVSVLLAVISAEVILSKFTRYGKDEKKIWINKHKWQGICFSSDPHRYFPVRLIDPTTQEPLYCVFYDYHRRRAGYFPQRPHQIAIIGDSFGLGESLKEEDTLGYLLGEKFTDYNFQNFSFSGADINYVYRKVFAITQAGENIKAIIYFYNLNDLLASPELKKEQDVLFDMQNIRWGRLASRPLPFGRFLSASTIFRLLRKRLILHQVSRSTIQNYRDMYFGPRNRILRQRSTAFLKAMNDLAEERDIEFFVVVYPLFYKDILGRYPFEDIHSFLMDACAENQITCFDTYKLFKEYYSLKKFIVHPIDYHPNRLANQMIVDFLAEQENFLPISVGSGNSGAFDALE